MTVKELDRVKDVLLPKIRESKRCIIAMLDEGHRDFDMFDEFIAGYKALQKALDILSEHK